LLYVPLDLAHLLVEDRLLLGHHIPAASINLRTVTGKTFQLPLTLPLLLLLRPLLLTVQELLPHLLAFRFAETIVLGDGLNENSAISLELTIDTELISIYVLLMVF
jgi:hypothetical protein